MTQSVARTSTEQKKALVRAYFDEINKHNAGVLEERLVADYVDHNPPPFPNLAPGQEGARQAFSEAKRVFPDGWHVIGDQVADGDLVLTVIRAGGTFADAVLGIPPTGKPVSMTGMALHRLVDDKLAEHWSVLDLATLFRQVGVIPSPAPVPVETQAQAEAAARRAATPGASVDPAELRAVMARFADIFNTRDLSIADEILAPEFTTESAGLPPIESRDAWKQLVLGFLAAFPDMHISVEQELAEGDKWAGRWTWRGTHGGDFMGAAATGKTVQVQGIGVYRIAGGKIVSEHVIEDIFGLMVQLGMVPPPGGGA